MLSVFVVSKMRLLREGVARLLEDEPSLSVIGCGDLGAVRLHSDSIDVVLIDAGAVHGAIANEVEREYAVVAFGVDANDDESVMRCARCGIRAFADLDATLSQIVTAVNAAVRNNVVYPQSLAAAFLRATAQRSQGAGSIGPHALTSRERDVLALVERNLSNKEIAGALRISVSTAKNHIHNILQKLSSPGRREAVAFVKGIRTQPESDQGTGPTI
jgi:two-component system nitrate/nitrite response regulator NarL